MAHEQRSEEVCGWCGGVALRTARAGSSVVLAALLWACDEDSTSDEGSSSTTGVGSSTTEVGSSTTGVGSSTTEVGSSDSGSSTTGSEPTCEATGKPEMTGPVVGLQASYGAGDPIDVGIPVDEDTARVIVGIYEVGSRLYLGGTAEDVAASSTTTLSFYAGVAEGATGTFYLAVELCSTAVCTTPFVRNTYDRADTAAPLASGETYVQTREFVGGDAMVETCRTSLPIQTFLIE